MERNYNDAIGSGGLYPIHLTKNSKGETGWYPVNGDTKLIENNLISLINYSIGQRFRQENFGTRLWECIEEPNTQALEFLVETFFREALETWETRITFKSSEISRKGSKMYLSFTYVVNLSNASKTSTLVYDNNDNSLNTKTT